MAALVPMSESRPPGTLTVSVALCTYKGASYLGKQLESVLAQTRLPQEMVVFDDASPDGTWALLEAFEPRIRAAGIRLVMHRNPVNVGFVANFEQALQATTGDIVFLCDQDDVWHLDKIEQFDDFDPYQHYEIAIADAELLPAEREALTADDIDVDL